MSVRNMSVPASMLFKKSKRFLSNFQSSVVKMKKLQAKTNLMDISS